MLYQNDELFGDIAGYMVLGALLTLFLSQKISAPYGRYAARASSWWGPDISGKFAWFLQELPSVLWAGYFLFFVSPKSIFSAVLIIYFFIHYFQRTFIFPLLMRGAKPTKFIPFLLALIFCTLNGYLQCGFLSWHFSPDINDKKFIILFSLGSIIFFIGMFINIHSDHLLRNLRKPGETGHKIPRGGFFNYVSSANFFGEILEWFGFAMASAFSLPTCAFAFFTFCAIGTRGQQHHRYYLQKFKDYPKNRKAVIPFIL